MSQWPAMSRGGTFHTSAFFIFAALGFLYSSLPHLTLGGNPCSERLNDFPKVTQPTGMFCWVCRPAQHAALVSSISVMGGAGAWTRRALRFHVLPGPLLSPPRRSFLLPPPLHGLHHGGGLPSRLSEPRHQGKDRGQPPSRSCATITLMSACSCFSYQRTFASGRWSDLEVWLGWVGAGTHPAFLASCCLVQH